MESQKTEMDFMGLLPNTVSAPILIAAVSVSLVLLLIREAYKADLPKVAGVPEPPSALPFLGHLRSLGGRERKGDCVIFSRWAQQLKSDIFQIRLGSQRAIIVCSWPMIRDLWVGQSNALIDRPWQPGFIDKLGVDISSSPMTETIKRCRAAAMRALGKPMWPSYYHLLEPSSVKMAWAIHKACVNGALVDLYPHFRQVVFDLVLSLTYGARMDDVDDEFSNELLDSLHEITSVRSSTEDFYHYVPILRLIPKSSTKTILAEKRRRVMLDTLYAQYQAKVAKGSKVECIVSNLGKDRLTIEEIRGTCTSLLQAAPETVASGAAMACAWMAFTPEGREFQTDAYKVILEAYDGDRNLAWDMAFREEKVPLISSFYKEALRCYPPTPFAQGRATVKDIEYQGVKIPKGITMIMNAHQANLSQEWYGEDSMQFRPDRFINDDSNLPMLTFGAGSRQCPATRIGSRMMYSLLQRMILAFEFKEGPPGSRRPSLDYRDFSDEYGLVTVPRAFDCRVEARDAEWLEHIYKTRLVDS